MPYTEHPSKENDALAQQLMENYHTMTLPPEAVPWNDKPAHCTHCEHLERNSERRPARPKDGDVNDLSHVCPHCQRRWWQFNEYFHFLKHVTNPAEWDTIRRQQIMINAGFGMPGAGN